MRSLSKSLRFMAVFAVVTSSVFAQSGDPYGDAVSAYYARDYGSAVQLLDRLVERNTTDPRVYFVRGLIAHAEGRLTESKADFAKGAELEATGKNRVDVGKALERVQGPLRVEIETARRDARRTAAASGGKHVIEQVQKSDLARGIEQYFDGNFASAKKTFDRLVDQRFVDPRLYYFRGLSSLQLGDTESAKADFELAVNIETQPENQVQVDRALSRVQGAERHILEQHRSEVVAAIREEEQAARKEMLAALLEDRLNGEKSIEAGLDSLNRSNSEQPTLKPRAARRVSGADAKNRPSLPVRVATKTPMPSTNDAPNPSTTVAPAATQSIDVKYLPADSQLLLQIRLRELLASPLVAPLKAHPEFVKQAETVRSTFGVGPDDLESVTAGLPIDFASIEAAAKGAQPPAPGSPPMGIPGLPPGIPGAPLGLGPEILKSGILVVRTRVAINTAAIEGLGKHEKADHQGKSFYRATDDFVPSVYLPDSQTAVVGMEDAVKAAIDQTEPSSELAQRFSPLNSARHFVFGVVPSDPSVLNKPQPPNPFAPPSQKKLQMVTEGKARGVVMSITVGTSIDFESLMILDAATTASEAGPILNDVIKESKGLIDLLALGIDPKLAAGIREVYETLKGSARGNALIGSFSVSPSALAKILEGAQAMGAARGGAPVPPAPPAPPAQ